MAAFTTATAATAADPDFAASVDPLIEPLLKEKPHVGLVVGIGIHGKQHIRGYGLVKTPLGEHTPDGDTMFEIGSITKTFTGILLAEAVRRKEVKLEDHVNAHLPPDLKLNLPEDKPITLLQLATHRSGLPVQPPLIGIQARNPANPYLDFDRVKLAALCGKIRPLHDPDTKYLYSNLAVGLLGHALVNAARAESFDAIVKERVCKPLKLTDTAEAQTGAQKARLAQGRTKAGKKTDPWDFATLSAAGGLRSTTKDMLTYAAANMGTPKTDLLPAMIASHGERAKGAGGKVTVGLGWHRTTLRGGRVSLFHGGGTGGYRTMLALTPDTGLSVVILSAVGDLDEIDPIALKIIESLQPAE